ncbi:uncharacterized protein LOC142606028 [Castanea sativa]|uniref:uncharacterized protein LOC142606028 n=1 Tax=Castanea sativa TaxID=21020 RepID=UPI003F6501A2
MQARPALSFSNEDKVGTYQPHDDALLLTFQIRGFDGKTVVPRGMIRLSIQVGSRAVEVNFIGVDAYSPYTAILARPWLHAMEVVSLTLHLKVNYPSGDHVEELIGSQAMARQCLVTAIRHQSEDESLGTLEKAL